MMVTYGEDIGQLEVKIADTMKQVQKLTANADEQVESLAKISRIPDIVILSRENIINFIFDIQNIDPK